MVTTEFELEANRFDGIGTEPVVPNFPACSGNREENFHHSTLMNRSESGPRGVSQLKPERKRVRAKRPLSITYSNVERVFLCGNLGSGQM